MKVFISLAYFVLDEKKSESARKNDKPIIKILLNDKNELLTAELVKDRDIKQQAKDLLGSVGCVHNTHFEQVYTFIIGEDVYILYLAVGNREDVVGIVDNRYQFYNFDVALNSSMTIGNNIYDYETREIRDNKGITYVHDFHNNKNPFLPLILTSYKYIKSRIDITDIMYRFMPSKFALEDVRLLYEHISGKTVDKSNFRKKIAAYLEPLEEIKSDKGYRPTRLYRYKVRENDIWL